MGIFFEKLLAKLLFAIYDFIDTLSGLFNVLSGTQAAGEGRQTFLEIFISSTVSTKVLLGLCLVGVVVAGACVGVRTVKNIVRIKAEGEPVSHMTTVKQGIIAVGASVVCIAFVFMFISFSGTLLNMVNDVIAPKETTTMSQNLFALSVEESPQLDMNNWEKKDGGIMYDESGEPVIDVNNTFGDGFQHQIEYVRPYLKDDNGNYIMSSGWIGHVKGVCKEDPKGGFYEEHGPQCLDFSKDPDQIFGVHGKTFFGLFEDKNKGYEADSPGIVDLEAFNMFTAYLVAVIIIISMFMLSIGLVKRGFDIVVLFICMPLVCGTIPLDDGARFRAWRETLMSKVLIVFGAVISLNVFFMMSAAISGGALSEMFQYLLDSGGLSPSAVGIFKMLLLIGGAVCINGFQAIVARILGTSADEGREAMQSFALITSGVRMGVVGAVGAGRLAAGGGRLLIGGTNRYGRQRTGIFNYAARGANMVGERIGGERYVESRGGQFVRMLGRMGGRYSPYQTAGSTANGARSSGISAPTTIPTVHAAGEKSPTARAAANSMPTGSASHSSAAFKNQTTRKR